MILESLLEQLGTKVRGDVLKFKVDPDDILSDAVAIYKDPEFYPELLTEDNLLLILGALNVNFLLMPVSISISIFS